MVDDDILATLKSIEKLLKKSSSVTSEPIHSRIRNSIKEKTDSTKNNKIFKASMSAIDDFSDATKVLTKSFNGLDFEVNKTTKTFASLTSQMLKFSGSLNSGSKIEPQPFTPLNQNQPQEKSRSLFERLFTPSLKTTTQNLNQLDLTSKKLKFKFDALGLVGKVTSDILEKVTKDFFKLSAVGMGSADNLYVMSKNALMAGMSLEEYSGVVKENMTFASRAGSMENFDKVINSTKSQLASLGVFGQDAIKLSAGMAESFSEAGISQKVMSQTLQNQIPIFERLREKVNMTADEFGGLIKNVISNTQSQKELVGLAPAQRNARLQELISIGTFGKSLGLSNEAANKLTQTMLEMRGLTVKDRFEESAKIRQMGAALGMFGEGEKAAQIVLKGRRATGAETQLLQQIAGRFQTQAQNKIETGSFGQQNLFEELQAGAGKFGKMMEDSTQAVLAKSSGQVFNEDFGKHVGGFGQSVAQFGLFTTGLKKSIFGSFGEAGGVIAGLLARPIISKVFDILNISTGGIRNMLMAVPNTLKNIPSVFSDGLSSILPGLGKILKKGVWLSGIFGGIEEAWTGQLSAAFNADGSGITDRIGAAIWGAARGIVTSVTDVFDWIFGTNTTNYVDRGVTILRMAWTEFKSIFVDGMQFFTKFLSDSSGLKKQVNEWSASLEKDKEKTLDTWESLIRNPTKTLTDIGKENLKTANNQVKDIQKANTKVIEATRDFNSSVIGYTTDAYAVIQDAKSTIGVKQEEPKTQNQTVNTPTNNTPQQDTTINRPEQFETDTAISVLEKILQVLKEGNEMMGKNNQLLARATKGDLFSSDSLATQLLN